MNETASAVKMVWRATCVVLATMTVSVPAHATNGMWMIGNGAKGTSLGGAGVANPVDGMAAAYNPALMTAVGETRMDLTLELFRPPRAVNHVSSEFPADTRSKDDLFPIPAIGAVLSSPGTPFAMGMAVIGAGLGTNYPQNFFNKSGNAYERVGVFLMQMQMLPSIAYRIDDHNSVGASLSIAAQTFRAFGLEDFASRGYSSDNARLTNNGYDWGFGWGYRLGWLGTYLNEKLHLGLMYAPRVEMQKFNRYSGLFANHGEFDIPESYTIGFALQATPKFKIVADIQRIMWNDVDSIGNPGPLASDPSKFWPSCDPSAKAPCQTGGDLSLGFGWKNQTAYKLGVEYRYNKDLTVRGGLNYGKSPIPKEEVLFNMLAPATVEKHVTAGFTKAMDKDSDFTFTLMHAFKNTICGPTAFSPFTPDQDNACIAMSQTSLSFAYGLRF
jgi:long-chain fatty acid transport protein